MERLAASSGSSKGAKCQVVLTSESKQALILSQSPLKGKAQNDVPQLQNRRCKKFGKLTARESNAIAAIPVQAKHSPKNMKDEGPLGEMRISLDKAEMCLRLLLEGNSIRSIQRITGMHQADHLEFIGSRWRPMCRKLMHDRIKGVAVRDVEADEMWGFVGMKKMTQTTQRSYQAAGWRRLHFRRHRAQHQASPCMASRRPRRCQHRGFHGEVRPRY